MKNMKAIITFFLVAVALLATAKAAMGAVYINEVMAEPAAGESEWIELYNDGDQLVDLTGWTIEDGTGSTYGNGAGDALDGLTITAESYRVLTQGVEYNFQLNNDGDVIVLINNAGEIEDEIAYGDFNDGNVDDNLPDPNENESLTRIPDGNDNWFATTVKVTPNATNNNLPSGPIPAQILDEISETKIINLSQYITDADGEELTFSIIQEGDNNDVECVINEENLSLTIVEGWDDKQTRCMINAFDGYENAEFEAAVTITPALQIRESSIRVKGNAYNASEGVNVTPGESVTVNFEYSNNLDVILGRVKITATSADIPELNYEKHEWRFLPSLRGASSDSFSFDVPPTVGDVFELTITIEDETAEEVEYGDSVTLQFNVQKVAKDIHLNSANLSDAELTCTRKAELTLELTNDGRNNVAPRILVYNEEATGQLNNEGTFDFPSEPAINIVYDYEDEDAGESSDIILPRGTETAILTADAGKLAAGEHSLYIYVVDPFFGGVGGNGVGATAIIDFTVGNCLNADSIDDENLLTTFRNSNREMEVPLTALDNNNDENNYLYLNEDLGTGGDADYAFRFGTEPVEGELISCRIKNDVTLSCRQNPERLMDEGAEEKIITILESETGSEINETLTVTITPTLELSYIAIDGKSKRELETQEETILLKPLDRLELQYKVRNNLNQKVIRTTVELVDNNGNADGYRFDFSEEKEQFHLNSMAETQIKSMAVTIPADIEEKEEPYQLQLRVSGETEDGNQVMDTFDFEFRIEQEPSSIILNAALAENEPRELDCEAGSMLAVTYTNTGRIAEDDIVIQAKVDGEIKWNSYNASGRFIRLDGNGGSGSQKISLPIIGRGPHDITVELLYNFDEAGEEAANIIRSAPVRVIRSNCLDQENFAPEAGEYYLKIGMTFDEPPFSVSLLDEERGDPNLIGWFVNDEQLPRKQGPEYVFMSKSLGDFTITAKYNNDQDDTLSWGITVTNVPKSYLFTTNIPEQEEEVADFDNLVVENQQGKIEFQGASNLRKLLDLDEYIIVGDRFVSVLNSDDGLGMSNRFPKARVTLNDVEPGKTLIYHYSEFGSLEKLKSKPTICNRESQPKCTLISHDETTKKLVFEVDGFSTYRVVTKRDSDLEVVPAEISFEEAVRGETVSTNFTVRNLGTIEDITDMEFSSTMASKYEVSFSNSPLLLTPESPEATVNLAFKIPTDEDAGRHRIGEIKVKGRINESTAVEKFIPVYVNPKTFLKIEGIKVNGKSSGKLSIEESNEIEVTVMNEYTKDIEDVLVTVKMLDVDGDDIEEESEEDNIKDGDKQEFQTTFDLSGETLDEEEYTLEITAEGEATDGSEHQALATARVKVDRKRHEVIIKQAALSSNILKCLRQTNVQATIENIGTSDEDDIEIKVKNTALGIDLSKGNIELDKYSRRNNDYRATFDLALEDAPAGTYPITIELYREDKQEDTQELTLSVEECLVQKQASQQQQVQSQKADDELARVLQQQLQQQLAARQQAAAQQQDNVVRSSFRDSSSYTLLLGTLVVLVFIALVLALAVMLIKKK